MGLFRRLGKIEVCNGLSVSPALLSHIQSRELKYFRHLARHDSLRNNLLEGKSEGSRQRGRQQLMSTDDMKSWMSRTMQECTFDAKNRKSCKVILRFREQTKS